MKKIMLNVLLTVIFSTEANADDFLSKFKDEVNKIANPKVESSSPVTKNDNLANHPSNSSNTRSPSLDMRVSENWCKQQMALLSGKKINLALVQEEFKIKDFDELQTVFFEKLDLESPLKAYQNPKLWRSSFETVKIRALYDSFVAFPEPEVLAFIIDRSRNSSDSQEKNDARMALVFIHLMAPELSQKQDRWLELHKLAGSEHWTALVFKARLNAYGEGGFKQDPRAALGYLNQAGTRKNEYARSNGRYEWDKYNFEVPAHRMAFEITRAAPGKYPAWEVFNELFAKIDQAQQQYMARWPSTRAGKLSRTAIEANDEAMNLGTQVIKLSQSGNQNEGMLQNIASLRGQKAGDKQVIAQIDPKVELIMVNALKQSAELNDEQKKLLEQANRKRYIAQGYIAEAQADVAGQLFAAAFGGGGGSQDSIVKALALAPAAAEAQSTLIRSCEISRKWEQAMRVKKVNTVDKNTVKVDLSGYKDE